MKELQDIDLKELIESETGNRFNKQGFIACPFHADKTPSVSVKFFPDANKQKFKCFGCDVGGDAIDFIMNIKSLDYLKAREYLGMENIKTEKENAFEKIENFVNWQIDKTEYKKGYKLLGIFQFVNASNEVVYYKAKFLKTDGKKCSSYYHFEGEKIVNSRGVDEIPYNLYNVLNGIRDGKTIIFVEGEKDANNINSILRGGRYIATSIKGCKDLSILKDRDIKVFVLGDTGEAGEQYIEHIKYELLGVSEEFKIIKLPGLKYIGNNKDVTDWLEAGNSKDDLLNAFKRSLDLKSLFDLQQDNIGIYKKVLMKDGETYKRINLTDFQLIDATRMRFVDEDKEGVKLILKSCTGAVVEKIGPSTVFDDVKVFKNFLGTMDLAFKGKVDDLTDFKSWINRYWAIENEELHNGVKFIQNNDSLSFVTTAGAITPNKIETGIKASTGNIEVTEIEVIGKAELIEVKNNIFKFTSSNKSIPIIGTVINNLAVVQNLEVKEKLHHLLIIGESGSGKSTILANVIAPILNYPIKDIRSIGLITSFAFIRDLSSGNYPTLYDEFKPSALDRYKIQKISESLRNSYDRTTISRGDKSFKTKDFQLTRPIIIAGEESYPNNEKALIERSAIVYLSKRERTEKNTAAMRWIIDNQDILNKFGRSLINVILNLSTEEYAEIRKNVSTKFKLKNRVLTTATNIATGIEIFNILLSQHNITKICNYENFIMENIVEEVLDGGEDTKSTVEQMIILYNSMIEDGRAEFPDDVIRSRADGLYIRTSEMINQIHNFCNKIGSAEIIPMKNRDFRKQAIKSGYLKNTASKVINIGTKTARFDEYDINRMKALNIYSIVEPDLMPVHDSKVIEIFEGA